MLRGLQQLKEKFLLFKVAHQKDKNAFGELYNMYRDRLYRFIFYKVSKSEDAEDVVNDVFFKVWRFIQNNGEISNLSAFLYSTARNAVNDYYRNRGVTVNLDNLENTELFSDISLQSDLSKAQLSLEIEMGTDQLTRAMRSIKDEYREVLVMRYLDDMSFKDIAEALGKNEGNVRVLLHRATETLKKKVGVNENRNL